MKFIRSNYFKSLYKNVSGHILVNLFIMHGGGWLTLPAIVLFAHYLKLDSTPIFISIIFIRTVNGPFGLLLNEGLAVSKATHSNLYVKRSVNLVIVFQFLVLCFSQIFLQESLKTQLSDDLILIFSCSVGSLFSYWSSSKIYRLVIVNAITKSALSIISISPGISTLFIYILYFFMGRDFERVLFLTLVVPSVIQLLLVYYYINAQQNFFSWIVPTQDKYQKEVRIRSKDVIVTLGYIAILSVLMAYYRDELIDINIEYAAIILTLVNMITSIVNLFIKYNFIRGKSVRYIKLNFVILVLILCIIANLFVINFVILVTTLCLLNTAVLIKMDHFRILQL